MADAETLTIAFMRAHPAEAAHVLEAASSGEATELFLHIPARVGSGVLAAMLPRVAANTLAALPDERAMELLTGIGSQPSVAILRHIEEPRRSYLIAGLPTASAIAIKLLLGYPDDSVGSCVDSSVIALPVTASVRDAVERVRQVAAPADRIFIVNAERRLLGWVPLSLLMRAQETAGLKALLQSPPALLAAQSPIAGAHAHPAWQVASTLPVVERGDQLIGVLTRDALDRALQRLRPVEHLQADDTLAGILTRGYWQSLSGILETLLTFLPAVNRVAEDDGKR